MNNDYNRRIKFYYPTEDRIATGLFKTLVQTPKVFNGGMGAGTVCYIGISALIELSTGELIQVPTEHLKGFIND